MNASRVELVLAWTLGAHVRLVGSRQAPKRQLVPAPQTVPHLPQFWGSVFTALQAPLQATCCVGQVQTPLMQVAPVAHTLPQAPQFTVLVVTSLHTPLQSAEPVAHLQALSQQV